MKCEECTVAGAGSTCCRQLIVLLPGVLGRCIPGTELPVCCAGARPGPLSQGLGYRMDQLGDNIPLGLEFHLSEWTHT